MPISDLSDADIDAVYATISKAHGIDILKADRRAKLLEQVVEAAGGPLFDPGPLVRVYHGAAALLEDPSSPGVDDEQPDVPEVPAEAPAGHRGVPVGVVGGLPEEGPGVVGGLYVGVEVVVVELLGGEVAEVL